MRHVIGASPIPFAESFVEPSFLDAAAVHAEAADFVWRSLHRMGVRDADLEDQLQEVFIVVHRRLDQWDRQSKITTWLFGICLRVASDYRRRAWVRRERPTEELPEPTADQSQLPDAQLERQESIELLGVALDRMDVERRAIFVMYEIDEMSCQEIAESFGVPVGTVHSRLFTARKDFEAALQRARIARDTQRLAARARDARRSS